MNGTGSGLRARGSVARDGVTDQLHLPKNGEYAENMADSACFAPYIKNTIRSMM
jgi:hypothetical protein